LLPVNPILNVRERIRNLQGIARGADADIEFFGEAGLAEECGAGGGLAVDPADGQALMLFERAPDKRAEFRT